MKTVVSIGAVTAVLVLALTGCTYILRSPETTGAFTGLAALTTGGQGLRVMIIHGMGGPKYPGYAFAKDGVARLMLAKDWLNYRCSGDPQTSTLGDPNSAATSTLTVTNCVAVDPKSNQGGIRIYEVHWAPVTEAAKQELLSLDGTLDDRRAGLNLELKRELVNLRLSDPVMYLGEKGPVIVSHVQQAFCRMLTDTTDWPLPPTAECRIAERLHDAEVMKARRGDGHKTPPALAVISESLGSAIARDALADWQGFPPESAQHIAASLIAARTAQVFMMANQVPLFDLANPRLPPAADATKHTPPNRNLPEVLDALRAPQGSTEGTSAEMQSFLKSTTLDLNVVAFTDPNDLLSYPLPLSKCSGMTRSRMTCVNAYVYNDRWKFLNEFVNPLGVHTGYAKDKDVLRLMTEGTSMR